MRVMDADRLTTTGCLSVHWSWVQVRLDFGGFERVSPWYHRCLYQGVGPGISFESLCPGDAGSIIQLWFPWSLDTAVNTAVVMEPKQ